MKPHAVLLRSALGLTLIVCVLALAAYWASRSETVLRWAIEQGARYVPGKLTVEGVQGSLTEPIAIASLHYADEEVAVDANGIKLDWSPWLLLQGPRIFVALLHVDQLHVKMLGTEDTPTTLPPDLKLPLPVEVRRLEVGELVIVSGAETTALRDAVLAYSGNEKQHRLQLAQLTTPIGAATAELALDAAAPFQLSGKIGLASTALPDWPYTVNADLSGRLEAIEAKLHATVASLAIDADANIAPFHDVPLQKITARSLGLDLAPLVPGAPATALDVVLAATGAPQNQFDGDITAVNRNPGTIDKNLLPVRTLSARLHAVSDALKLTSAAIDLGPAGQVTGDATLASSGVQANLATRALNLRGIHSALRATQLAGAVSGSIAGATRRIEGQLAQDGMSLAFKAREEASTLWVETFSARAGSARLSASSKLALDTPNAFSADGELSGFDPAAFGDFPAAAINGKLSATGHLRPDWLATVQYRLTPSSYRAQPLSGAGQFTVSATHVQDVDARLALASNRLQVRGGFGAAGRSLQFDLNAPALQVLGPPWSGSVRAAGAVSGTLERPAFDVTLDVKKLNAIEKISVGALSARGHLVQAADPTFELHAKGENLNARGVRASTAQLNASGSFAQHDIDLAARTPLLDLDVRLRGRWRMDAREWTGELLALENRGDYGFKLTAPAPLALAPKRIAFGPASIRSASVQLDIGSTRYGGGDLTSSGSLTGLSVAKLLTFANVSAKIAPTTIDTNLMLGGRWKLAAGEHVNGRIELFRESGEVTLGLDSERLAFGLQQLAAMVDVVDDRVTGTLSANAQRVGTVTARAETRLERRKGNWGIAGNAPLAGSARADFSSIKPIAAWLSRSVVADGRMQLALSAAGTIAEPKLSGQLQADALRIEQVENGVFLRDGTLRATFAGNQLQVTEFTILAGDGSVRATGRAALDDRGIKVTVDWAANKLPALQRPDIQVTLTGKGSLSIDHDAIALRGRLHADQGRIELRESGAPSLGDDVVIEGTAPPSPMQARILRPALDLTFDFGSDFLVRGRGVNAYLTGQIQLTSPGNAPITGKGEISLVRGTFEAYGRKLDIDKGSIYFTGPLENPGLNIRAMRKNQTVEAGVEVTGTVRAPRVRLVSVPEVPDQEKLSWLVLGRKVDSSSQGDAAALQAASIALLADMGTSPLQSQVKQTVGLDELSFSPGESAGEGGVITMAKRLNDRIYVMFEQSLTTASNTFKINYQLTPRWSVRTESGTTFAVDLFYSLSFD